MEIDTQTEWSFSPHVFLPDPSSLLFWSQFPPPPSISDNFVDEDYFCDIFNYLEVSISNEQLSDLHLDSQDGQLCVSSPASSKLQAGDQILEVYRGTERKEITCEQDLSNFVSAVQTEDKITLVIARMNPNHDHEICLEKSLNKHVHLVGDSKTTNLMGSTGIINGVMSEDKKNTSVEEYLENEMKELEKECQGFMKDLESITCQDRDEQEYGMNEADSNPDNEKMDPSCNFPKTKNGKSWGKRTVKAIDDEKGRGGDEDVTRREVVRVMTSKKGKTLMKSSSKSSEPSKVDQSRDKNSISQETRDNLKENAIERETRQECKTFTDKQKTTPETCPYESNSILEVTPVPITHSKCGKKVDPTSLPKYDPKDKKESIKNWIKTSLENSLKLRKEKWSSKCGNPSKVAICQPNPRPLCPLSGQTINESINYQLFNPLLTERRLTTDQSTQMSPSSSDSCIGTNSRPTSSRIYEEIDPIINKVVLDKSMINDATKYRTATMYSPMNRVQKAILAPVIDWPSTMYTNHANLHSTVYLQQQLLKLSLEKKGNPFEQPAAQEWPQSSKEKVHFVEDKVKRRKKSSSIKKSSSFQLKRNSFPCSRMSTSNSAQQFHPSENDEIDHIYDEVSPEHESHNLKYKEDMTPVDSTRKHDLGMWKIKKRPDGTRYVTRDERRPKMMSQDFLYDKTQKAGRDIGNLVDNVRRRELTSIEKKRMSMVREEDGHDFVVKSELLTVATV